MKNNLKCVFGSGMCSLIQAIFTDGVQKGMNISFKTNLIEG